MMISTFPPKNTVQESYFKDASSWWQGMFWACAHRWPTI